MDKLQGAAVSSEGLVVKERLDAAAELQALHKAKLL